MKRSTGRAQKLGDLIQRELSELVQRELRDPRVGMITITSVDVSPDFSHAKVFYTTLNPEHVPEAGKGLKRAAGFLRSQLARRIKLTPRRSCASNRRVGGARRSAVAAHRLHPGERIAR